MGDHPTLLACLTPSGSGAIAVLALRGPNALNVIRDVFQPAGGERLPPALDPGRVWFGNLGDGSVADEVVLVVRRSEPHYEFELHPHGGRQLVDWLMDLLVARGACRCTVNEYQRSVESMLAVAASEQLVHALTLRTALIALDQWHVARESGGQWPAIHSDSAGADQELLQHLTTPWRVVIAGPPNAGKSTLMNALAGFPRSVVAPIAGTTRDVVTAVLAIDGWPVELIDTAGLRSESHGLEGAGIDLARSTIDQADLVLWLYDAREAMPSAPTARRLLRIANKCDLADAPIPAADLRISALTGAGIEDLCAAISRKLVPVPPPPGASLLAGTDSGTTSPAPGP